MVSKYERFQKLQGSRNHRPIKSAPMLGTPCTYLWVVILNNEDTTSALLSVRDDGLGVDRLHGERVHDSNVGAAGGQGVVRQQGLADRDAGGDDEHLVLVGLLEDLGLADGEGFVVRIDDFGRGSADPYVTEAIRVGC